ncbi:MAG: transcriptional repressor [Armatimonadetes bacterium]|nr:transcriptional repressor [Armatimonadota bacterium]
MERKTRQRDAIRRAFGGTERPLSPQEVLDAAQEEVAGLSIATVYRTLKTLLDEAWLVLVELPGEPPRYERAGKHHHHHFRCRGCGRVYEIHGCPGNLASLLPAGFQLEQHDILLYGRCAECVAAS